MTVNLKVPYLSQLDNANAPYGTCNLTCVAMCLQFFGVKGDGTAIQLEDQLFNYVVKHRLSRHNPLDLVRVFESKKIRDQFSFNTAWGEVRSWLDNGKPCIVHGYFTRSGHIIVLRGYDREGFFVNDPYGEWFSWGYDTRKSGENLHYSNGLLNRVCCPDNQLWIHRVG
jgi:uncharacterized protein YvpB